MSVYEDHNYDNVFESEDDTFLKRKSSVENVYITNNQNDLSGLNGCAIAVIAICMLVWSGMALSLSLLGGIDAFINTLVILFFVWIFAWFLYWLGYKLYWITLALSWVLGTLFMLLTTGAFTFLN